MNEIRWTDKVYLDSQGNIISFDGVICGADIRVKYELNRIKDELENVDMREGGETVAKNISDN